MCNAKNHPPGCVCGFGGPGHAGRRSRQVATDYSPFVPPIRPQFESYTSPNAKCPVCGVAVFFYQSSDGGRVFFDELGPPWPKHHCTDNESVPKRLYSYEAASASHTPSCMGQGWDPLFILRVLGRHKYVYEIKCNHRDSAITIYFVKRRSRHSSFIEGIRRDTIAFLKTLKNGRHEVSLLSVSGVSITVLAYSRLSEAIEESRALNSSAGKSKTKDRQARRDADCRIGIVKWFDTDKGFGFITINDRQKDIYVHSAALERSGVASLLEGQRVRCRVGRGSKGLEVKWIKVL